MTLKTAADRTPTLPTTMRAAAIDRFGPPKVLTVHTLPVPQFGLHEMLIQLYAAGVGSWDASVRDGSWRPYGRPKFPLVPGTDGAGVIVAKGSRIREFHVGDRVYGAHYANPKGGFYAEFTVLDEQHVARVPKRLDMLQAGAAPVPGLTALQGVDDHLNVRRGETVLIFGATGAVGTLAIQFARRLHARVLATASGGPAAALVRELGANSVVDARSADAAEELENLAPDGIDAVLHWREGKRWKAFCSTCERADEWHIPMVSNQSPPAKENIESLPTMQRLVQQSLKNCKVRWMKPGFMCQSRQLTHCRRLRTLICGWSEVTFSADSRYGFEEVDKRSEANKWLKFFLRERWLQTSR
jgi:NADPH:quinone reductase-like Zn-dependent oxidoreductase